MTFNTWNNGRNVKDGVAKIAGHILTLNADIVAVQEIETEKEFKEVLTLLGSGWDGVFRQNVSYPDSGIITRHELMKETFEQINYDNQGNAVGVQIRLKTPSSQLINFWSVHLDWSNYGPYAACNKKTTSNWQIYAGEYNIGDSAHPSRVENVLQILRLERFQENVKMSAKIPLILAGDFNAPSHLDWTVPRRDHNCGWAFDWPATQILAKESGLKDAFREVHPDPQKFPGITWSAVQKTTPGWGWSIPEPQDRIDYIHYKSSLLKPVKAKTYTGTDVVMPKPYYSDNNWPSDHLSVFVDFIMK